MMDVLEAARRLGARAAGRRAAPAGRRAVAGSGMSISLERVALRAMVDNGFQPEPTGAATTASWRRLAGRRRAPTTCATCAGLLWSSIDNVTSKDLDQIEVAEATADGGIRLRIGIADVDALVPKGSAIDAHAGRELDLGLHRHLGVPDAARRAVDRSHVARRGRRAARRRHRARDRPRRRGAARTRSTAPCAVNHAKLDYESVGAWLEGRGPEPDKVAADDALEAQLWLQDRAAGLLEADARAGRRPRSRHRRGDAGGQGRRHRIAARRRARTAPAT